MFKIMLTGNIGKTPELRTTVKNDFYVASVAVNIAKDKTQWVDLIISSDNKIVEYIKKGCKVLVEGRPSINNYKNKDGLPVSNFSVSVFSIEILSSKTELEQKPLEINKTTSESKNEAPF